MADDTKNATLRSLLKLGTRQVKSERAATVLDSVVEVDAAADPGSVYTMARVPSRARIHGLSEVAYDDLASVGSPTIDFGFAAVSNNITTDPDALNNGIDVTSAGTARLVADHANYGQMAWEYVDGQTEDPGGFLDLIITLADAASDTGGDITLTVIYSVD